MPTKAIPSLINDFSSVNSLFQERGIWAHKVPPATLAIGRRIHSCTYSLILWRFRLGTLPQHSGVFVEEIASDALQILPQIMMGYGKTAKILTRTIIENVLRHLYFTDHPVEFVIMNREEKWYIGVEKLIEYAKSHPDFVRSERQFDALNRFSSLYSDLSAGIHGRRVRDLEMRAALSKIEYEEAAAIREVELVKQCTEASNFLLAIFHRKKMRSFTTEDRRIILRTMGRRAREVCGDFE